jgi:ferric-dicitrate binding protein FerR (iron transport regulator)
VELLCLPVTIAIENIREAYTKEEMTKDTIIRFLNNRCTSAELDEIIRWANTEAFSEESTRLAFDDWKSFREERNGEDDEKFSLLFDKIQQKITVETRKNKNKESRTPVFLTWLTRAAAILLFPVLAFLFYTLSENAEIKMKSAQLKNLPVDSLEIIAPIGSRTVVQLTDGSEVHLNYGSRLKYPQTFTGDKREVLLTGEGYFDVAHNPGKPFIVKTNKLNVKALGTAFNVLAYPDDDAVETTLVNGKVVLESVEKEGIVKTIGSMTPGQHVNYNVKTGTVLSSKGNIEKFIAWKEGKLILDETTILEAAEKLSRMYNVSIEVDDAIKDYTYTVTFEDEPLFQILELMTVATPVRYKALPRKKLQDDTFSKQKIVFEKRR